MTMDDDAAAELEEEVEKFLLGWVDRKGRHQFFKFGSREQRDAQYAIARLLRFYGQLIPISADRKPWWLLNRLADLFDPSFRPHSKGNALKIVKFGFRREGGPGQVLRHRRIAKEMRAAVRALQKDKTVKAPIRTAIEAAIDRHGIGERQAKEIWRLYGKKMM